MPGPGGTIPGCGRPASARRETLCLLLGGRERSTEPLFLNGEQINRKIKLIGEALAPYALGKDNGVGIGEVSGGLSRTEGMSPGRPRPGSLTAHPARYRPGLGQRPTAERSLRTGTLGDPASFHLPFSPHPCVLLSVYPSIAPSIRSIPVRPATSLSEPLPLLKT